ncbi:MAG: hypothetical protein ACMUJM_20650 [bacterium]
MRQKIIIIFSLILILYVNLYADLKKDNALYDEIVIELLDGRLSVSMPKGSKIEARHFNIMSAQKPAKEETRVVFEEDNKKLVLMAFETFLKANANFESTLKKEIQEWAKDEKGSFKIQKDQNGRYLIFPESFNTSDEAIFIQGLYIVNFDETVQWLAVYVNPYLFKNINKSKKLSNRIINSVKKGCNELDVREGKKKLSIYNDKNELLIEFPKGYVHTVQEGPDFLVHRIREITDFGSTGNIVGIYVGGHPSFFHSKYDKEEIKIKKVKRTFLCKKIEWIQYTTNKNSNKIHIEAIFPLTEIKNYRTENYWNLHIFLSTDSEKKLEKLFKIMNTARIEEKK